MEPTPYLITAVDHPSLFGQLDRFVEELRSERPCSGRWTGRIPAPELIDRLSAPQMLRLGTCHGGRLIAVAAVANDGAVAVAALREFRRTSVARDLMDAVTVRTSALGYPTLHRFTASRRLAG